MSRKAHGRSAAMLALVALVLPACGNDGAGGSTGARGVEIAEDATWSGEVTLTDLTFVTNDATLTIEAGTRVLGDAGSALIITRDGSIDAQGTASNPIVFTSSKAEGLRRRGDWGGVVLLGSAPINVPNGQIEGIESSDARGSYGGSDPTSDCGTIRYARIEFAGFTIGADNELNGLTLGGCGTGTTLEYIQVHMGDDDGIELFGGTVDVRYLVVSRAADDSLDWDEGFQGRLQFVVVQQEAAQGDNGIEADNLEQNNDATPRSGPTIYNATFVGSRDEAASQRGMVIRRGTAGSLWNAIVMGFPDEAIDIRDEATVGQVDDGNLTFGSITFYDIGGPSSWDSWFGEETGEDDDDGGFDEWTYFSDDDRASQFGVDPELGDPYSLTAPDFVPAAESEVAEGVVPEEDGWFDTSADYRGAFKPGAATSWMDGWTAFPNN